jgi:hypothetical protein
MSCLLTSGLDQNCARSTPGGNKSILYLIDREKVSAYVDASPSPTPIAVINSVTLTTPSDTWFKVVVYDDTLVTSETLGSPISKFINQSVTFQVAQLGDDLDLENAAMEVASFLTEVKNSKGLVVLVQDSSGVWRLFGETLGLRASEFDKNSGTTQTDVAGTTITLTRGEQGFARAVESTYITTMPVAP